MLKSPIISKNHVSLLVQKCYELETTFVKQLNGYDDKNFYIKTVHIAALESGKSPETSSNEYILKILNSEESKTDALVEGQNLLMVHASKYGLCVPLPLENIHGTYLSQENLQSLENNIHQNNADAVTNIVRIFKFLPGTLMKDGIYTKLLMYEVGQLAGRLHHCFKNFKNEAIENREYIWKLGSFLQVSKYLSAVKDKENLKLAKNVLDTWRSVVEAILPSLEKGIIHSDMNEQNLLVDNEHHLCGILDFGDVSLSPLIFELAIAVTYVFLEVESLDPFEAAGYVVGGYASQRKIPDREWSVLVESVAARFIQSLVFGAHSYQLNPENKYLLCTAKKGWLRLTHLWSMPKEAVVEKWKAISIQAQEEFGL